MTARELLTLCCRIAADANIHYCLNINEPPPPAWDGLTNAMQEGMIKGAQMALAGSSPEQSHENWCKTRLAEGWEYATITDRENKKHACLVPYNELPEAQRVKDALFQGVVCAVYDALMPGDRAATHAAAEINIERHLDRHKDLFSRGEVRQMSAESIAQLLQEFQVPSHARDVRALTEATDALRATTQEIKQAVNPGRIFYRTEGRLLLHTGEDLAATPAPGVAILWPSIPEQDKPSEPDQRYPLLCIRGYGHGEVNVLGRIRLGNAEAESFKPSSSTACFHDPKPFRMDSVFKLGEDGRLQRMDYWQERKGTFGVQRFGSGWRVYAAGNRIICDIEAGDELVRCFGKQIEDPAPTGEPPSDLRAKLDAELQQEEGQ